MTHAEINPRLFVHTHVVDLLGEKLCYRPVYMELNALSSARSKGFELYSRTSARKITIKFVSRRDFLDAIDTEVS
jgi:hypothetical protein